MQQRFLLQILLLAQHVSGTTMSIIRSSRVLYSGCCLWYLVLWFSSLLVWCGAEGYVCGLQDAGNRGFYCRLYCMLNMFRVPLCPSSGAQEYYTVVAACGISCCGFQVAGLVCSWRLWVRFAGCCNILQTGHITLTKYHRQQPLYNTLELLMMGIVVPKTCWASNKICNKNLCCI